GQLRPARRGRSVELVGRFVVAEAQRVRINLFLHGSRVAKWYPIIGAVVGDERLVQQVEALQLAYFQFLRAETVLKPNLMIMLPEVVVLSIEIHSQFWR